MSSGLKCVGRGTIKIIEECKAVGLPTPVFTNEFSGLQVTFRGKKTSGKTSEKIIKLVGDNKKITIAELSKEIGVTARTIERNLKKLQDQKKITRVGGAKGGHWELS